MPEKTLHEKESSADASFDVKVGLPNVCGGCCSAGCVGIDICASVCGFGVHFKLLADGGTVSKTGMPS